MAVYNLFELMQKASEIVDDGYAFSELSILEADDDFPESLLFSVPTDDLGEIDYGDIEAYPESCLYDKLTINKDTPCHTFTYGEVALIQNALVNSLSYGKEILKSPDTNHATADEIKSFSARTRNLLVKIEKILKQISQA